MFLSILLHLAPTVEILLYDMNKLSVEALVQYIFRVI
jgi:hypothetical protein